MLCIVFAIHCLSLKKIEGWVTIFFSAVVSLAVCWQAVAHYIFKMEYGTFSNPHYLSNITMLLFPVIAYSFLSATGWSKYVFIPVALIDMDLLLKTGSRPAVLGLTVGSLFVFIFLTKGRWKWISLLMLCGALMFLYITDYGNVYTRFEELIATFSQEERIQLWDSAWNMLKDNSVWAWIFGNGIGSGRSVLPQYSVPQLKTLIFSHNYVLEICYENGIVGVLSVFGGIGCLLIYAIKVAKQTGNKKIRILIKCMIVTFLSWLIHTGLTFPFYSKYSQYSLSFILGTLLSLLDNISSRQITAEMNQ